jgi:hypothetical protein
VKDDRKYLLHILECIGRIEEDVSVGRAALDAAHMIQDAVIRNLRVTAESTQRLARSRASPGGRPESVILGTGAAVMIQPEKMTDEQFERHALEMLRRELGLDGLARFLRLNRSGSADYTKDRAEWQKDLTVDQIVETIRQGRTSAQRG